MLGNGLVYSLGGKMRKIKNRNRKKKLKVVIGRCPFCKDVNKIRKLGFCPCKFSIAVFNVTNANGSVTEETRYFYAGKSHTQSGAIDKYNKLIKSHGYVLKSKVQELKKKQTRKSNQDFYNSREWRELRFDVLKQMRVDHGKVFCQLCFAENTQMHVDHIKPRSKYPELELDKSNLQILCASCNFGKSNRDDTDFR